MWMLSITWSLLVLFSCTNKWCVTVSLLRTTRKHLYVLDVLANGQKIVVVLHDVRKNQTSPPPLWWSSSTWSWVRQFMLLHLLWKRTLRDKLCELMPFCHPTVSVKALKETPSTDPNKWPGLIRSSSSTGILMGRQSFCSLTPVASSGASSKRTNIRFA